MDVADFRDLGHVPDASPSGTWPRIPNLVSERVNSLALTRVSTLAGVKTRVIVVGPVMNFHAHFAPLDIVWYHIPDDNSFTININWVSHTFVTFHGSWNCAPPTGFGIVQCVVTLSDLTISSHHLIQQHPIEWRAARSWERVHIWPQIHCSSSRPHAVSQGLLPTCGPCFRLQGASLRYLRYDGRGENPMSCLPTIGSGRCSV